MSLSKHRTLRVRILVKAFPQPSKAHEETVCCAGVTEDGRELLRLFPIRFRRLPREHQFDRFDLVQMTATKASDPRPESFRVDEGSIVSVPPATGWRRSRASGNRLVHEAPEKRELGA